MRNNSNAVDFYINFLKIIIHKNIYINNVLIIYSKKLIIIFFCKLYHIPFGKFESITIKLVGNITFSKAEIISPTYNLPLCFFPFIYNRICLSNFALWQSSIPSRINGADKTITKGTIAVVGPKGDIIGIHCKIAEIKKYIFAGRLNL